MNNKRFLAIEIIKRAWIGLLVITGFSALVMVLWNLLIPEIFGLKLINFWQAAGLFALCRILFGHFGGGKPGEHHGPGLRRDNHIREKWMNMTEEEREDFVHRRKDFFRERPFNREDLWGKRTNRKAQDETTRGE